MDQLGHFNLKTGFFLVISLLLLTFQSTVAQSNADDIVGIWLTQKKDGKVEIFKQGDKYYGKITWLSEPTEKDGKPKVDNENPDATKRNQPIMGLIVVKHLQWKGEGNWEDGKVYDPDNGKTYSASAKMKNKNLLEFTGFIGFSFIGRTEVWTRVK
jgi:uncharacterized protein (DUF2147 family)